MKTKRPKTNSVHSSLDWANVLVLAVFVSLAILLIKKLVFAPIAQDSPEGQPSVIQSGPGMEKATPALRNHSRTGDQKSGAKDRAILMAQLRGGLGEQDYTLDVEAGQVISIKTRHGEVLAPSQAVSVRPCPQSQAGAAAGECLYVKGGTLKLSQETKAKLPRHLFLKDQSF